MHLPTLPFLILILSQLITASDDRGLEIDASCNQHYENITIGIEAVRRLLDRGIWETNNKKRPSSFNRFFRPGDRAQVRKVYKNIQAVLDNTGPTVTLVCGSPDCDLMWGIKFVVSRVRAEAGDREIAICPRQWETWNAEVEPDYCRYEHNEGLATGLLHELTHFRVLTEGVWVMDGAYKLRDCETLREKDILQDQPNGQYFRVKPIKNAQSYALMPVDSLKTEIIQSGECEHWKKGEDGKWRWTGFRYEDPGWEAYGRDELRRRRQLTWEDLQKGARRTGLSDVQDWYERRAKENQRAVVYGPG